MREFERPAPRQASVLLYVTLGAVALATAAMLLVAALAAGAFTWSVAVWAVNDGPLAGTGVPAWMLFAGALTSALLTPALMVLKRACGWK